MCQAEPGSRHSLTCVQRRSAGLHLGGNVHQSPVSGSSRATAGVAFSAHPSSRSLLTWMGTARPSASVAGPLRWTVRFLGGTGRTDLPAQAFPSRLGSTAGAARRSSSRRPVPPCSRPRPRPALTTPKPPRGPDVARRVRVPQLRPWRSAAATLRRFEPSSRAESSALGTPFLQRPAIGLLATHPAPAGVSGQVVALPVEVSLAARAARLMGRRSEARQHRLRVYP